MAVLDQLWSVRSPPPTPKHLQSEWVLSVSEGVLREAAILWRPGRGFVLVGEGGTAHWCSLVICLFPFQVPFSATMSPVRLHSSNPNLCADIEFQTPPSHLADPLESSTDYTKLQEEFCLIAQKGNNKCYVPCQEVLFFDEKFSFILFSAWVVTVQS